MFGTSAARFNDDGVTALYQHLRDAARRARAARAGRRCSRRSTTKRLDARRRAVLPAEPGALPGRDRRGRPRLPRGTDRRAGRPRAGRSTALRQRPRAARRPDAARAAGGSPTRPSAPGPATAAAASTAGRADRRSTTPATSTSCTSATASSAPRCAASRCRAPTVPRVALPPFTGHGELLRFLREENLPGHFPFTAGVFPFKREARTRPACSPARATPSAPTGGSTCSPRASRPPACRPPSTRSPSTASTPPSAPDIYGKVGNSGVSIATLDDMKVLYGGFDLCDPTTSVSMTINGPAPTHPGHVPQHRDRPAARQLRPSARAAQPVAEEARRSAPRRCATVRGTVQADILKEDQGQNTCIFSTEFALRMMADIQEWFIEHEVRNFYSVSISGYHIAEAGANPITQLAFTLANGFTYVEAYLARGMDIDDFAPNLSFFFSNGMDPEYTVLGRVARRIWAVAMRDRYGANDRSQKLKYHVQTSGRSLHAQEMDVQRHPHHAAGADRHLRQLQQPAHQRLRRGGHHALERVGAPGAGHPADHQPGVGPGDEREPAAGQLHHRRAHRPGRGGGARRVRPDHRARRRARRHGDRLPARPHPGRVDALRAAASTTARCRSSASTRSCNPDAEGDGTAELELARAPTRRSSPSCERLRRLPGRHADEPPRRSRGCRRRRSAGENVFAVLMDAVRVCSLGEITDALFEVGGQYRRSM